MAEVQEPKTQVPPSWFHPDYPSLGQDDVGKAAIEGQFVEYPMVVRKMIDPPIVGQKTGNLSFMLFNKPRDFRGKPIYGYVKMRGNHENDVVARKDGHRIISDVDSKFQVRSGPVGSWLPITESDSVVNEIYDTGEKGMEDEKLLRTEALKEKEAVERRQMKELRESEEALKSGGDVYDDPTTLDFYTMKRVTEMRLFEAVENARLKVASLENTLRETHFMLRGLEVDHSEYADQWIANYNAERNKTSIGDFVPAAGQFAEYEATSLDEIRANYPVVAAKVEKDMAQYGKKSSE